ncbi:MAG: IS1096 element passenger TnpR family protein [Flavobacteriaceae bacterium]
MIYRFRAILDHDSKEDIFRDIEIRKTDTFEDLFNVLTQSFGFDGSEMASFYVSDDQWQQGQEIALFDMGENEDIRLMNETIIEDVIDEDQTKLIFVYDFLNMWTFLVELGEIVDEAQGTDYPNLMFVCGQVPSEAPEKQFEADQSSFEDEDEDYRFDDYDEFNFDEHWN